jgi:formate-dependent nitrite reductase membrane component NrfD
MSDVTRHGDENVRPGRDAASGQAPATGGRKRRGGMREQMMVPRAEFRSYYGLPILNPPRWGPTDVAGYLFLGGLAGASSVLAAGAELTGRPVLARAGKVTALVGIGGSTAALIHDLGRPDRFHHMLRVFKPTSPMSVGSWILATYGPLAGIAAATAVTGWFPRIGKLATAGAALAGPAVATYTGVLIADTAVPAWHGAHELLPFTFAGSAAAAAGGLGMIAAPVAEAGPARRVALLGSALETATSLVSERRMGMVGEAYRSGKAGKLMTAARILTIGGALGGALLARRSRSAAVLSGLALLAGSAATRFGIFEAGVASAEDPKYTVVPQRERMAARSASEAAAGSASEGATGSAFTAVSRTAPERAAVTGTEPAPATEPATGTVPATGTEPAAASRTEPAPEAE